MASEHQDNRAYDDVVFLHYEDSTWFEKWPRYDAFSTLHKDLIGSQPSSTTTTGTAAEHINGIPGSAEALDIIPSEGVTANNDGISDAGRAEQSSI